MRESERNIGCDISGGAVESSVDRITVVATVKSGHARVVAPLTWT